MIKDLYHGKVFPSEKIPNHSNPEYEKLSEIIANLRQL